MTLGLKPVDDWTWMDWQALADWFTATLIEDDHRKSLAKVQGRDLVRTETRRVNDPARVHPDFIALNNLCTRLEEATVDDYAVGRVGFVRSIVRRVGVPVVETNAYFDRFMGACLAGELAFLDVALRRRLGQKVAHRHPDEIEGRWRTTASATEVAAKAAAVVLGTVTENDARVGKTLLDCHAAYAADHARNGKPAREAHLGDMKKTVTAFEGLARVDDIGLITRRHIVDFRNHLIDEGGYAVASVNKRVGYITTLLGTALTQG